MIALLLFGVGLGVMFLARPTPKPFFVTANKKTKKYKNHGNALLMGDITNLNVSRPNYDNPRRKGTRLMFDLNVCNLGFATTVVPTAKVTVFFKDQEETRDIYRGFAKDYTFELGKWVTFSCMVYFDDFPDDTCLSENVKVYLTDERNVVHIFSLRS